jgi:hypothetical protein
MTERCCPIDSPGWHWIDDGNPEHQPRSVRCPALLAAAVHEQAMRLTEAANDKATEAARCIVADAAASRFEFSSNDLHDDLEAAQIPGSVVGPAFTWAAKPTRERGPLIEPTGRYVMSNDPATRHRVQVWRSTVYRLGRTA